MLWIGLLAVMAVLAAARFWWARRSAYVEEIVPFNFSADQVEAARRLIKKEPQVARTSSQSVSTKPDGKKMTDAGTKAYDSQANAEKALKLLKDCK